MKYLEIALGALIFSLLDYALWRGMHWLIPSYSLVTFLIIVVVSGNWSLAESLYKKRKA